MSLNCKSLKSLPKSSMMSKFESSEKCNLNSNLIKKLFYFIAQFFMSYFYYPIKNFFNRNKIKIKRAFDYGCFGWSNYDFDMFYVWVLFEFKLKRLYKCLENGFAIQNLEDMDALKELIKIVHRLGKNGYENKYFRDHDKKWGKIEFKNIPNYDENGKIKNYTWNSWRKNCPENASKNLKAKERKDYRSCLLNAEKDRIKDINRMADIIKKHGLSWWD